MDSPPTYSGGRLFFGSADGRVTSLRASDGAEIWTFQAAPFKRLIGVRGQLESAWPVHGSVLILEDTAYFAAGRSSYADGGIHLFGLDVNSGRPVHHVRLTGPEVDLTDPNWFDGYNDSGGRGALADILQLNGGLICMRNRAFDRSLRSSESGPAPHIQPMGGFLDDTYYKRYYWYYGTAMVRPVYASMARPRITEQQMQIALAQLLVQDDSAIYGMRMYDSMKLLNANNYFVPGEAGYLVFKIAPGAGEPMWTQRLPVRATAMAVSENRLLVAGPPDILDPADPLGAFEARKGGRLRILSINDGSTLEEHELSSPPVFQGVAAARGRIFVSLKNGKLLSFGGAAR